MRAQRWRTEGRFVVPAVIAAGLAVYAAGRINWVAHQPLWLVLAALLATVVIGYASDHFGAGCRPWQFHLRLAAKTASIAFCLYLTGWGPMLMVGLLYTLADTIDTFGPEKLLAALGWAAAAVTAGELAIATGIAPSMVRQPVVHGLAVLAFAGLAAAGLYLRLATMRRLEALRELALEQERFRALVQHSSDVILLLDASGRVRYASPSASAFTGATTGATPIEETPIEDLRQLLHPDDLAAAQEMLAAPRGETVRSELRIARSDGEWRYLELVASNLLDNPGVEGIVINGRDITERKLIEQELAERATHDPLTGLANRVLLVDRLSRTLTRLERRPGDAVLLYLDLDHFKEVNDLAGHEAGDALLVTLAQRLLGEIRASDTLARVGGDEFVALLDGGITPETAMQVANRMIAACEAPVPWGGGAHAVSASVGVVSCQAGQSVEEVLRQADLAMYMAKQEGRARASLFGAP